MSKRNLFAEITEGFDALAQVREGKRTLRTHQAILPAPPKRVTGREIAALRGRLNMSQAVFASYLRTNQRTLQNWEQGKAKPNTQATLVIRMVEKFPDTVERLAKVG